MASYASGGGPLLARAVRGGFSPASGGLWTTRRGTSPRATAARRASLWQGSGVAFRTRSEAFAEEGDEADEDAEALRPGAEIDEEGDEGGEWWVLASGTAEEGSGGEAEGAEGGGEGGEAGAAA